MPRYFFHHVDGYFQRDEEGIELADIDLAAEQAVIFAGESLQQAPKKIWSGQDFRVEVTDDTGLVLFTVVTMGIKSAAIEYPLNP